MSETHDNHEEFGSDSIAKIVCFMLRLGIMQTNSILGGRRRC